MSTSKAMPPLSNLQFVSEEEVAISLERLIDSVVMEVAANRSAQQLQQVNESNDDALGIDSLPNEIIEKIFSYLTQNKLGQIARVCKKWSMLTKSPVLWRKVNVTMFRNPDSENDAESFNSFIDGLPSCVTFIRFDFAGREYLDYPECLDFEKLCTKLQQNCPHVEVLILKRCEILTTFPEVINVCTQFLQGLKKLVFRVCQFKRCSGTVELKVNSNIEVLDLYCSEIYHSSKIQFSKLLSLKELRLASIFLDDTWFVGDISLWNQLHVLDLRQTFIFDRTFRAIQRHGQNLKELYLCNTRPTDRDFSFHNPVFPHLKTICLSRTLVTCLGLVSLVQSCPSLVNVYVDEDVAQLFAEHPFAVANRYKSGIVKSIHSDHNHNVDYLHS